MSAMTDVRTMPSAGNLDRDCDIICPARTVVHSAPSSVVGGLTGMATSFKDHQWHPSPERAGRHMVVSTATQWSMPEQCPK